MEKNKIDRINFLARESRVRELESDEKKEQAALRAEYIAEFRASFGAQLAGTVIKRPDGSVERLPKKK